MTNPLAYIVLWDALTETLAMSRMNATQQLMYYFQYQFAYTALWLAFTIWYAKWIADFTRYVWKLTK